MKSEMRAWILYLFLLFSYLFWMTTSLPGSRQLEDTTSAESTMTLELIHRDDPRVAGDEIKNSGEERFQELVKIDSSRYKRISRSPGRKDNGGRDDSAGQYSVQVWMGTPSEKYLVTADMTSHLTWLNCRYESANGTGFDGRKTVLDAGNSSSFQTLPCSSRLCDVELIQLSPLFSLRTCPDASNPCEYDYRYGDAYHAKGMFGTDTIGILLTNGTTEKIHDLVIGCTTDGGTLTEDGVLGLGIAKDAFVDKLATRYGGKFSYCLVDHLSDKNCSSHLTFGDITGFKRELQSRIQYTKLVEFPPYHAAHLVNISVGDQILPLPPETFDPTANNGIVVMDSGSSLTTLPSPVYDAVINVLKKCFKNYSESKPTGGMQYCYKAPGFDVNSLPKLVLYFAGGVRFEPPLKSYIVDVGPQVKCIGLLRGGGRMFVLGNMMLQNHTWQFDLFNRTLGFATSTCT